MAAAEALLTIITCGVEGIKRETFIVNNLREVRAPRRASTESLYLLFII
jgi:hypothetical protein